MIEMIKTGIEIITFFINLGFIYFFSNLFLSKKVINRRTALTVVVATFVSVITYTFLLGISYNELGFILLVIYVFTMFEEKLIPKVFVIALNFLLTYFVEVFIEFSKAIVSGRVYSDFINDKFELYNLTVVLLRVLILLVYIYICRKKTVNSKISLKNLSKKNTIAVTSVLFASFIFMVLVDLMLTHVKWMEFNLLTTFLLFTMFMALIILIGVFVVVHKSYKEKLLSSNNNLLQIQLKSQLDHYNQLENGLIETRKIKHDMQNHMTSLNYLIRTSAYEEALEYLSEINNKLSKIASGIDTGNVIFDAIYIDKSKIANAKGIEFVNVNCMNQDLDITYVDMCTILSNTMDNAIEACDKITDVKEKKVRIESFVKKGHWIYKIVNPADPFELKGGTIVTSKTDKRAHGFGLINIKETVDKYDGTMDVKYRDGEFILEIVIKNKA